MSMRNKPHRCMSMRFPVPSRMIAAAETEYDAHLERGTSAVERRTRNQVSPGSNPPLLPFRRLGIFVLSIDAPVDSAV